MIAALPLRSLGARLFLVCALLVALVVGAGLAATSQLGRRHAAAAAAESLEAAVVAQAGFERLHFDRLQAVSELFARDPDVAASFAPRAAQSTPTFDQLLAERQQELGFDFVLRLTPDGRRVAPSSGLREDALSDAELARRPLVAAAVQRYRARGVWAQDGELYYAAAAPVVVDGFDLVGFLVAGVRVDEALARDVSRASGAQAAYVALGGDGRPRVVAATPSVPAAELVAWIERAGGLDEALDGGGRSAAPLAEGRWLGAATPLEDADGEQVGALVALASLDRHLLPYRHLHTLLLVAGGLALLLAAGLSYALARGTLAPVRRLAAVAAAARGGDFSARVGTGGGAVALAAKNLDGMLAELEAQKAVAAWVAERSRQLPEAGRGGAAEVTPRAEERTLVAAELRRYARGATTADPERSLTRLGRDLRRAEAAVGAREGRLEAVAGHRLLASFAGAGKSLRALAAASEILTLAAAPEDAFDETVEPLVALAAGEVARGSSVWGEGVRPALAGLPVQKLESLLREATPGEILLTREVYRELTADLPEEDPGLVERRGVVSPLPLYVVDRQSAARLTGVDLATEPAPASIPGRGSAAAELVPGRRLGGRFELLGALAAAGVTAAFRARDHELGAPVDLYILEPLAADGDDELEVGEADTPAERHREELRRAREIHHPQVVRIYDFGELDALRFVSTEPARGVSLARLLEGSEGAPPAPGRRIAEQLCAGLAAAHAQGVSHRRLRPEAVLVDGQGEVRLSGFGLTPPSSDEEAAGPRRDLYDLGAVFYELFTGRSPFAAGGAPAPGRPAAPRELRPDLPAALEGIILRCLDPDPAVRPASAAELLAELESSGA